MDELGIDARCLLQRRCQTVYGDARHDGAPQRACGGIHAVIRARTEIQDDELAFELLRYDIRTRHHIGAPARSPAHPLTIPQPRSLTVIWQPLADAHVIGSVCCPVAAGPYAQQTSSSRGCSATCVGIGAPWKRDTGRALG